ncbi:hypothetical protein [Sporisorium scitamineum]|uniref:Transmembrane protein n=1 Tax=Sporisorium scitamineum TaxID=49012 RepID=A0A0F7RY55_9BASI|nr:hypothetical protein [Sporisorium scitamineum]
MRPIPISAKMVQIQIAARASSLLLLLALCLTVMLWSSSVSAAPGGSSGYKKLESTPSTLRQLMAVDKSGFSHGSSSSSSSSSGVWGKFKK